MNLKGTVIACAAVIILILGIYFFAHDNTITSPATATTGCRAQAFSMGATGNCVKDIQTMTNYMETAGLTECHFTGSQTLPISGTYDSQTNAQVKVIQGWANCYYKQEGLSMRVTANGSVDNGTWTELCDFAYTSPKQSNTSTSPYTQASIAAGKNAHC